MLHTPVASASYDSQPVARSQPQSRHRVSASIGKTHFKLAPGLLPPAQSNRNAGPASRQSAPAPSNAYYDEQWQGWMSPEASSSRAALVPSAGPSSYDSAWQRWMATYAPTPAPPSSPALFESVPRESMLPIMSRLPLEAGDEEDAIASEPTRGSNLDYLTALEEAGGVHPEEQVATTPLLKYTRARLPVLDSESYHLWKALHSLRSLSDDYAEGYEVGSKKKRALDGGDAPSIAAPHPVSQDMDQTQCPAFAASTSMSAQKALALVKKLFNWDELPDLPKEVEYTWYGVAFRSKRREGSESVNLYEDDRRSHEEAVNSGGLLMYWYGAPSQRTGHNLATCIWTSRQDAIQASSLPLHARAAVHARKAYESFELSRYAIRKVQGETRLRLEEWVE